jgi:hypothetical protein
LYREKRKTQKFDRWESHDLNDKSEKNKNKKGSGLAEKSRTGTEF